MVTKGLFTPWYLGPTIEITAFTLTSVSTLVVLLRFFCRIWVVGRLKSYDYLIAGAVLCTWGLCVINHFQIMYGTGTGEWPANLPPPTPEFIREVKFGSARVWYAYQIIYLLDPAFIKLSILVFYLTIATHRTFRILVYITIGFVTAFSVVMILVNAFECPHKPSLVFAEDIFIMREKYRCFDLKKLYFSQAAFNLFFDVGILVLPLPILLQLRMPTFKRICLLLVFSIGLLVPIAAAFRIWALSVWASSDPVASRYNGGYILFWDQVEMNTAIICASAPSLQPFFRCVFGELSRLQRTRSAYYFYGEGQSTMTQRTIGRRPSYPRIDPLESPTATYHQNNKSTGEEVENELVVIREVDEEEEIRNRVRAFTRPNSANSQPPKSPARPHDILSSG